MKVKGERVEGGRVVIELQVSITKMNCFTYY